MPPESTVTDPPVMLHTAVPLGMLKMLPLPTEMLPADIARPPVVAPPSVVVPAVIASVPPLTVTTFVNVSSAPIDRVAPDGTTAKTPVVVTVMGLSVNVPASTLNDPDPSNWFPEKVHAFELWKTPPAATDTDAVPVMLHVVVPLGMLNVLFPDTATLPAVIDRPPVVPLPSVVVAALPATASASVPPLIDTRLVNVLAACTVTCPLLIVTAGLNAGCPAASRNSPDVTVTVADANAPNTLLAISTPPATLSTPAAAFIDDVLASVVVPAKNASVPPPIHTEPAQSPPTGLPPYRRSAPVVTFSDVPEARFTDTYTDTVADAAFNIDVAPAITNLPAAPLGPRVLVAVQAIVNALLP